MDKKTKQLVEAYNWPGTLLVISSFPEKGARYSNKVCAVGGYAKNTLDALKTYFKKNGKRRKIVVLTVTLDKEEIYEEDGVLVWRIFKRDNPLSYLKLIKAIARFNRVKDALVEFEFASFGNTKTSALFPTLLLALRLWQKNVVLVLHQVVSNLEEISGHLGWRKKALKAAIFNFGLKAFYWLLAFLSNRVVVLEEEFKRRLIKLVGIQDKVVVIPHGVDAKLRPIKKTQVRKKLGLKNGEPVVLYFGYLTWYKGADFLLKSFSKQIKVNGKSVRLIVAGGESTTQREKPHYREYLKKLRRLEEKAKNTVITGFVSEKDFPLYFAAADLVVLPYRAMMSSSGPLSLACSFGKPFVMSNELSSYFDSADFKAALEESGLQEKELLFPLQEKRFASKLRSSLKKQNLLRLARLSRSLTKKRDFSALVPFYLEALESGKRAHRPKPQILLKPAFRE